MNDSIANSDAVDFAAGVQPSAKIDRCPKCNDADAMRARVTTKDNELEVTCDACEAELVTVNLDAFNF